MRWWPWRRRDTLAAALAARTHLTPIPGPATTKPGDPPQGVYMIGPEGIRIDLDVVSAGVDEDGFHRWLVVQPIAELIVAGLVSVHADLIPGRTSLVFDAP